MHIHILMHIYELPLVLSIKSNLPQKHPPLTRWTLCKDQGLLGEMDSEEIRILSFVRKQGRFVVIRTKQKVWHGSLWTNVRIKLRRGKRGFSSLTGTGKHKSTWIIVSKFTVSRKYGFQVFALKHTLWLKGKESILEEKSRSHLLCQMVDSDRTTQDHMESV